MTKKPKSSSKPKKGIPKRGKAPRVYLTREGVYQRVSNVKGSEDDTERKGNKS